MVMRKSGSVFEDHTLNQKSSYTIEMPSVYFISFASLYHTTTASNALSLSTTETFTSPDETYRKNGFTISSSDSFCNERKESLGGNVSNAGPPKKKTLQKKRPPPSPPKRAFFSRMD